jgi:hypothetical protein
MKALSDPEYVRAKAATLRELRHAIQQVQKDQHLNAQWAMTGALQESMRCFAVIRSLPEPS